MIEIILPYLTQLIEGILILSLFFVALLFTKVDKKLNALKSGTDGIGKTLVELNLAIDKAQNAVSELKINTSQVNFELDEKIAEAKKTIEGLKFLNSVQKALKPYDPNGAEPKGILEEKKSENSAFAQRKKPNFEDLPPINAQVRNRWGGLR